MEYQQVSYVDMGFNELGLSQALSSMVNQNQMDAFYELGEGSVRNSKVRNISADKITAGTLAAVTKVGDESIVLDGEGKTITINGGDIIIDGNTGTITTDKIIDSTYGFYGVFAKVYKSSSNTGTTTITIPKNGGLLDISVNMDSLGVFIEVPGWNGISPDFEIDTTSTNYVITLYNGNIHSDFFPLDVGGSIYVTLYFNSLETNGF